MGNNGVGDDNYEVVNIVSLERNINGDTRRRNMMHKQNKIPRRASGKAI